MAWNVPRTAGVGDVYTSPWYNADTRDNFRYFKGLDGPVEIEDDLDVAGVLSVGGVGGQFTPTGYVGEQVRHNCPNQAF